MQSDGSVKRQVLSQLRLQDYSMYLMVSKLLEEYNADNRAELNAQVASQAAQPGGGGNGNGEDPSGGQPGGGEDSAESGASTPSPVGAKSAPNSNSPQ